MRKLIVFNHVTLDGYFTGARGDFSWAHGREDAEWNAFVAKNATGGGQMLFGRITYELMISYWPTPAARKNDPVVAEAMNQLPKVVFSKTLDKADWNNTKLIRGNVAAAVKKMKEERGKDMVIFGSGTIVSLLAQKGLIDEYQMVMNPIVLGKGRTMFEGLKKKMNLKLTNSRTFHNGNVLLSYEPA